MWHCQDLSVLRWCWARLHRVDWWQIETSFQAGTGLCRHARSLGGTAFVAMMQSTDLGERDDLARSRSVYGPGLRTILVEREMRPGLVIIMKIR